MIIKCISKDFFSSFWNCYAMQMSWNAHSSVANECILVCFGVENEKSKVPAKLKKKVCFIFRCLHVIWWCWKKRLIVWCKEKSLWMGKKQWQTFTRPLCCYCRAQVNEYTNVCKNNFHCVFPFYSSIHFFCSFSSRFKWLVWYYYRTQLICILNAFNYKN